MGVNAFHSFGVGGQDTRTWNVDFIREFIGDMKQNPISGGVIKDSVGSYLYSLQTIVDSNRVHHQITLLCPFGWDGSNTTVFSGSFPRKTPWWSAYKIQLSNWAQEFKNQPDVWIEVWNEPYRYDRKDGYSDSIWNMDMNEMIGIIRNSGNNNMVIIPCAEQGQDETVLDNFGNSFLKDKQNILFDIHAYEKWLLVDNLTMSTRLNTLQTKGIPFIFGEIGPLNSGVLMNPAPLLDTAYQKGISVSAWTWKYSNTDPDALLNSSGIPNNNANNNWGSTFYQLLMRKRNP